jgi:hypothetical protein
MREDPHAPLPNVTRWALLSTAGASAGTVAIAVCAPMRSPPPSAERPGGRGRADHRGRGPRHAAYQREGAAAPH